MLGWLVAYALAKQVSGSLLILMQNRSEAHCTCLFKAGQMLALRTGQRGLRVPTGQGS